MWPPIGLKSMQNTTFLVLLTSIFAPKTKIPPSPLEMAMTTGQGLDVISTRKLNFSLVEELFLFFVFWRSPESEL